MSEVPNNIPARANIIDETEQYIDMAARVDVPRDRAMSAVCGFGMCEGCEEEIVALRPGERNFCEDCKRLDDELRWRYATCDVTPVTLMQPREDVGTVLYMPPPDDLPAHCLAGAGRGQLVAVAGVVTLGGFALFCLVGWFGLRALTAVGIWVAR